MYYTKVYDHQIEKLFFTLNKLIDKSNVKDVDNKLQILFKDSTYFYFIRDIIKTHPSIIKVLSDSLIINKINQELSYNCLSSIDTFILTFFVYKVRPTNATAKKELQALKKSDIKKLLENFYTNIPITTHYIPKMFLSDMDRFYVALYLKQLIGLCGVKLSQKTKRQIICIMKTHLKNNNIKDCEDILLNLTAQAYEVVNKKKCSNPKRYISDDIKYVYLCNNSTLFNIDDMSSNYKKYFMKRMLSL